MLPAAIPGIEDGAPGFSSGHGVSSRCRVSVMVADLPQKLGEFLHSLVGVKIIDHEIGAEVYRCAPAAVRCPAADEFDQ